MVTEKGRKWLKRGEERVELFDENDTLECEEVTGLRLLEELEEKSREMGQVTGLARMLNEVGLTDQGRQLIDGLKERYQVKGVKQKREEDEESPPDPKTEEEEVGPYTRHIRDNYGKSSGSTDEAKRRRIEDEDEEEGLRELWRANNPRTPSPIPSISPQTIGLRRKKEVIRFGSLPLEDLETSDDEQIPEDEEIKNEQGENLQEGPVPIEIEIDTEEEAEMVEIVEDESESEEDVEDETDRRERDILKEITKQFRRFTRAAQARKTEDRWTELERASGDLRRDIRRIREIEEEEVESEEVIKERWQEANRRQKQIEREMDEMEKIKEEHSSSEEEQEI